jgi:hypothetical protein
MPQKCTNLLSHCGHLCIYHELTQSTKKNKDFCPWRGAVIKPKTSSTPAHKLKSAPLNVDVLMVSDQRPHLNPGQHSREHLGFRV